MHGSCKVHARPSQAKPGQARAWAWPKPSLTGPGDRPNPPMVEPSQASRVLYWTGGFAPKTPPGTMRRGGGQRQLASGWAPSCR
eukprot:7557371-Alexandrium_andersonii.AAC.1